MRKPLSRLAVGCDLGQKRSEDMRKHEDLDE